MGPWQSVSITNGTQSDAETALRGKYGTARRVGVCAGSHLGSLAINNFPTIKANSGGRLRRSTHAVM
jgi:hypothetical protein